MQRIINTLIRFKNFLVFILLFFLSVSFSYNRSFYHRIKIDKFGVIFSGLLYTPYHSLSSYLNLIPINKKLIDENKKLKSIILNNLNSSQESSTDLFKITSANVIKNSYIKSRNFIILDKGENDGIKRDMSVISLDGIIGIINETSKNYSNVISILNIDMKINVKLKKSNAFGSLEWKKYDPTIMELSDISTVNNVKIGDTIVTGGMSFYFPQNIFIGVVKNYKKIDDTGFYSIQVKLNSNMTNLTHAYIIENIDQQELNKLNNSYK